MRTGEKNRSKEEGEGEDSVSMRYLRVRGRVDCAIALTSCVQPETKINVRLSTYTWKHKERKVQGGVEGAGNLRSGGTGSGGGDFSNCGEKNLKNRYENGDGEV
mmetsp:Transcript_4161/g.8361  ORF Transcript_4161/g.8361 Transcript_4161/m.8361 type:complete len:104 (-) Transcript_4161:162-473(-)